MTDRADVLVHGATGFTGRLVCEALKRRGVAFAVGGRSAEKLGRLAADLGGVEIQTTDIASADSLRSAVEGRKVVCACAGPFAEVGESMLSTCARAGVHYVDTTGEQQFVARVMRYRATAEASGACVVPAMAYEIALADWGAHLAAERCGESPDAIDILYAVRGPGGAGASRGTKRSALLQIGSGEAQQYVDGSLRKEALAANVREFTLSTGKRLIAVSFPSPEAVVVPSHTGARAVRTYMPTPRGRARVMQWIGPAVPSLLRLAGGLAQRVISRAPEGPDAGGRDGSAFEVLIEARRGTSVHRVHVTGTDPYGLTAELQAYAAAKMRTRQVHAKGVVAPSVAFDAREGLQALGAFGVKVS